jgi:hypothetical protein
VVGFYDGIPRVGQDVFKIEVGPPVDNDFPYDWPHYFQASLGAIYEDKETGPDGEALSFTELATTRGAASISNTVVWTYYVHPGDPGWVNPWVGSTYYPELDALNAYPFTITFRTHVEERLLLVGPVLYIFTVFWYGQTVVSGRPDLEPGGESPDTMSSVSLRAMIYRGQFPPPEDVLTFALLYSNQDPSVWDAGACDAAFQDGVEWANLQYGVHYDDSYFQSWFSCYINHVMPFDPETGLHTGYGAFGQTGVDDLKISTTKRDSTEPL